MTDPDFRFVVSIPAAEIGALQRAARKAGVSDGGYISALFDAFSAPEIGLCKIESDSTTRDRMGHLCGNLSVKSATQDDAEPVDNEAHWTLRTKVFYERLCKLSGGKELRITNLDLAAALKWTSTGVSRNLRQLAFEGKIVFVRGNGCRKSVIIAPCTDVESGATI